VLEKAGRKHYDDVFSDMHDLVGLRVVCLFVNDIAEIAGVIRREFDIVREENMIDGGVGHIWLYGPALRRPLAPYIHWSS
jgi:hypothetical protein